MGLPTIACGRKGLNHLNVIPHGYGWLGLSNGGLPLNVALAIAAIPTAAGTDRSAILHSA